MNHYRDDAVSASDWIEVGDLDLLPSQPVVSVLMLTYNHEPFLAEAIEGVVAQRAEFDFELVIGEDCSQDASREIAFDYQAKYPQRIRIIHSQANVGMMRNFRRILAASKGSFIAICEGDDYWIDPLKLHTQVAALAALPGCDISFHCSMVRRREEPALFGPIGVAAAENRIIELPKVIVGGGAFMPSASILIRGETIRNIKESLHEKAPNFDYFMQLYGARRGGALYLNRPMSVYRVDVPQSFTSSMADGGKNREFQVRFYEALKEAEIDFPTHRENFTEFMFARWKSLAYASALANDERLHGTALGMLADRIERLGASRRVWLFVAADMRVCALMARLQGGFGLARRIRARLFSRELLPWLVRRCSAWWRAGA